MDYCYRNYELQFVPYFASGRVPYKNIPGEVTSLGDISLLISSKRSLKGILLERSNRMLIKYKEQGWKV
jgi:hypothetical protein